MTSSILILILAVLVILCLAWVIRTILGDSKIRETQTQIQATQISQAIIDFQSAQTHQLGELLDRHSSDLKSVLSAQSKYISQFLNGPTIQADNPVLQPGAPDLDVADPANWSLEDQMEHLPRQMKQEIQREQMEQEAIDLLTRPPHNIRYDPRVPVVIPGLSSEEQAAMNQNGPRTSGSWTMYDGPED